MKGCKKFLENPKKYISCPPKVPVNYRVSIIGPSKSGKTLIANMLSEIYGWRIIDMEEIYEKVKNDLYSEFENIVSQYRNNKEIDINKEGKIDFQQFKNMMKYD